MFLFEELKQFGGLLGFMVYNVIVGICVCEYQYEEVMELLDQMCGVGFQLDNVNYMFVFQVCVKKCVGVDVIFRVCVDIKYEGFEMDNKFYNDVINVYCCVGDLDRVF